MARVIRQAEHRLECPHCNALVGFQYNDLRWGYAGRKDHFHCPACRHMIETSLSDLPDDWRARIAREESGHG